MDTEQSWEVLLLPETYGEKFFFGNDGFHRQLIEVGDNEFAFWLKVGDPRQFHSPFAWGIGMAGLGILVIAHAEMAHFVAGLVGIIAAILAFGIVTYLNRRTEKHIRQARKLFLVQLGYSLPPENCATPDMVSGATSHVLVPAGVRNQEELEAYLTAHNLN